MLRKSLKIGIFFLSSFYGFFLLERFLFSTSFFSKKEITWLFFLQVIGMFFLSALFSFIMVSFLFSSWKKPPYEVLPKEEIPPSMKEFTQEDERREV